MQKARLIKYITVLLKTDKIDIFLNIILKSQPLSLAKKKVRQN
jgi:hypothetical protein